MIYTKQKTLFKNMRDLYLCAYDVKISNVKEKFHGIEDVFQKNGYFFKFK